MPAMSPTMTEGGIVSWKFKAGETFSSGDVLLEVETDKATIDVEAQDDGIMWEIIEQDGASGVPVGKPIALLAEQGDNLNELEKPDLSSSSSTTTSEPVGTKEATKEPVKEVSPIKSTSSAHDNAAGISSKANESKLLTPAVQFLLHSNHISDADAYANIPATGPQGRILKGDVLAYLGKIDLAATTKVASYVKSKEHLDLSNIKIAPPKDAEPAKKSAEPVKPVAPSNLVSMELSMDFDAELDRNAFKQLFGFALENAKRIAYATRFPNFSLSPISSGLFEEDIFDDLLVAPVSKSRLEMVDVHFSFSGPKPSYEASDVFDELLGNTSKNIIPSQSQSKSLVTVGLDIKFDNKLSDSKEFLARFQDALRNEFEWKQVVIRQ